MRAIKKINGSLLISPRKRKKQKTVSNLILKSLCQRSLSRGVARTFQRRGGRVTLSQIEGTHRIVMSTFMPCLKKVFKGAGFGHGHLRTLSPQSTSLLSTCGFIRVKNQDFGEVDLSSSEFLRKMRIDVFARQINYLLNISQLSPE